MTTPRSGCPVCHGNGQGGGCPDCGGTPTPIGGPLHGTTPQKRSYKWPVIALLGIIGIIGLFALYKKGVFSSSGEKVAGAAPGGSASADPSSTAVATASAPPVVPPAPAAPSAVASSGPSPDSCKKSTHWDSDSKGCVSDANLCDSETSTWDADKQKCVCKAKCPAEPPKVVKNDPPKRNPSPKPGPTVTPPDSAPIVVTIDNRKPQHGVDATGL